MITFPQTSFAGGKSRWGFFDVKISVKTDVVSSCNVDVTFSSPSKTATVGVFTCCSGT